jgi:hypothetical protein
MFDLTADDEDGADAEADYFPELPDVKELVEESARTIRKEAAIAIQGWWCEHQTRRRASAAAEEEIQQRRSRKAAALAIQGAWREHHDAKMYLLLRSSGAMGGKIPFFEMSEAEQFLLLAYGRRSTSGMTNRELREEDESNAALSIQGWWREHQTRRRSGAAADKEAGGEDEDQAAEAEPSESADE